MAICDVRDPAAPKQVATVRLDGRGDGVCVRGGILYAAMGHHRPGAELRSDDPGYGTGNGLEIYDVSNPIQPKHLSRVKFDWRYYFGYPDTWRVKLAYPYAYLYHTHNGVFILEVSDPTNPKELRQIRVPLHPGDKGFRAMPMTSKNGLRQPVLPFDPTQKIYSPVCGLVATDGYLYFAGMFSDLHVFHDQKLAKAESGKESPAARGPSRDRTRLTTRGDFHQPDLEAVRKAVGPLAATIGHYRSGGQVYAAVENHAVVYAACGSAGIHVLDKHLQLQAQYPTPGFAMDVQVAGNRLYAAESAGGLGIYQVDGPKLERLATYASREPIKQVRVSPNGRFAVLHVGGALYQVLDLSDEQRPGLVKTERGWGGLVYYRQLSNGFIDGKYICETWCAGLTFMLDLGGSVPQPCPDVVAVRPDMEAGGYCACGPSALLTREGGYSLYKPGHAAPQEDLPVYKIKGGPEFYGKPTCRGDLLAVCNRIRGDVMLVDISDRSVPRLIGQFRLSGNVDCAFIGENSILLPTGYQGLFRLDRAVAERAHYQRGRGGILRRRVVDPDRVLGHPLNWPASEAVATGSQITVDAGNVNATTIRGTHYLAFYSGKAPDTAILVSVLPAPSAR